MLSRLQASFTRAIMLAAAVSLGASAQAQQQECLVLDAGVKVCDLPERFRLSWSGGSSGSWDIEGYEVLANVYVDPEVFEGPVNRQTVENWIEPQDGHTKVVTDILVSGRPAFHIYSTGPNHSGVTRHIFNAFADINGSSFVYIGVASLEDYETVQADFMTLVDAVSIRGEP